jgi:hypothetical protein
MKIENIIRRLLREQQEEQILKIPSIKFFNNDWNVLQKFLESQGNPRYSIGGDLDLRRRSDIKTLGNLVRVEGDLDLQLCKNLVSLGDLEYVGGFLDLRVTKIETLGNLKYVGGLLDLGFSDIKSLGNLVRVDSVLYLFGSKNLQSLGDLEYVGGDLVLQSTPLSKKYTEKEIRKMVEVVGVIDMG